MAYGDFSQAYIQLHGEWSRNRGVPPGGSDPMDLEVEVVFAGTVGPGDIFSATIIAYTSTEGVISATYSTAKRVRGMPLTGFLVSGAALVGDPNRTLTGGLAIHGYPLYDHFHGGSYPFTTSPINDYVFDLGNQNPSDGFLVWTDQVLHAIGTGLDGTGTYAAVDSNFGTNFANRGHPPVLVVFYFVDGP